MDWKELEAGRELDRVIAERLGFFAADNPPQETVDGLRRQGVDVGEFIEPGWYVYGPRSGEIFPINVEPQDSADAAWNYVLRKDPECGEYDYPLRQWSESVDAALTLVPDWVRLFSLTFELGEWVCIIDMGFDTATGRGKADTPALAICRAWLAYKQG